MRKFKNCEKILVATPFLICSTSAKSQMTRRNQTQRFGRTHRRSEEARSIPFLWSDINVNQPKLLHVTTMRNLLPKAILLGLLWCGLNSLSINAQTVRQSGFLTHELYSGIPGVSVFDMFDSSKYPNSPDESSFLTAFDTMTLPAVGGLDDFGARITGWITPTESGQYEFFLRSDDGSELQLSTDDNPANLQFIAEETDCCDAFLEADTGDLATSLPVNLSAGQAYAVQLDYKEGGGGNFAQVAWRRVGDDTPAASLIPIPGAFLSTDVPANGSITVDSQPADGTVQEGRSGTFNIGITTSHGPVLVQWQLNGEDIPGAVGESVNIGPVSLDDDGGKLKANISIPGATATTDEVTLTVVPDTFPPVPSAGALLKNGNQEVSVAFDEEVDPSNLGDAANYTMSAGTIESVSVLSRSTDNFSPDITLVEIPEYSAVKVIVSGLTPGQEYSIGVSNVKDMKGNAITGTENATFTAEDSLTWNVVGSAEAGFTDDVIRVGDEGFDVLSGGVAFWSDYDEMTFVNEELTGDFDKIVQVEYQDPSSQWARTGLIMREGLDEGKVRPPQDGCGSAIEDDGTDEGFPCVPEELTFSRHQTVHANAKIRWDNGTSNDGYENNYRNTEQYLAGFGNQTNGADAGGGPLDYPNVWTRLARTGDTIMTYRSSDGVNWEPMTTREFEGLAETVFVGPFYAPELNNNDSTAGLGHGVLAKFRNYRDFGGAPPDGGGGGGGGGGGMLDVRVASGTDDSEEHLTEGNTIDLTSSDLELGAEGGGADAQVQGIRFLGIDIPAGSTITSASIQFTVDEADDEPTSVMIYGELAADPGGYTDAVGDITARARTTAVVAWNDIPVWDDASIGSAGPDQLTPDLASIVQEVVDQADWNAGNAIAFIIEGTENSERTAESFDGDAGAAPLLHIEFSAGGGGGGGALSITDGLVAHWPLNEGSGNVFTDIVGGFDGFLPLGQDGAQTEISWSDGPPTQQNAVEFLDSNSFIATSFPGIGGGNPRTVAFWVRTIDESAFFVSWGANVTAQKWHIRANGASGVMRTEYAGGQNFATTSMIDGEWHHVASVFPDGATDGEEILHYIDGVLDPRAGGDNQPIDTAIPTDPVLDWTNFDGEAAYSVHIGGRMNANFNSMLAGSIADVAIWNRGLSQEELLGLVSNPLPGADPLPPPAGGGGINTDGLVAYWGFDGDLSDSVGSYDGTAQGPVGFVDGQAGFGQAISLDGSGFVEILDSSELDFAGGSMSISGWFTVGAFDKSWQALIAKGEQSAYRVARRGGGAAVAYAGGVGEGADDAPAVDDGGWHHFVAISDASAADFGTAIYIDGVMYGVQATAPALEAETTNLYIGENPEALNRQWIGSIDDIGIWDRVLSSDEVSALYNGGAGTALSTAVGGGGGYTIGLNFGADEPDGGNLFAVAASESAGAPGFAQSNWNNFSGATGTGVSLADGTGADSGVSVEWASNGSWASTGRSEGNGDNFGGGAGADFNLMGGYLDTGDPTTTTVTLTGLPGDLTGGGYDVVVYALGGVAAGRSGGYRVVDASTGEALTDYVLGTSDTSPTDYVEVPVLGAGEYGAGSYLVFRGLSASNIAIEATTDNGLGAGAPARAPINAIQLVASSGGGGGGGSAIDITRSATGVTITFEGTLQSSDSVTGPYTDVAGATSPADIPLSGAAQFFRSSQ